MPRSDPEVVGARLKSAREAAGMSLSVLAQHVHRSRAALGHYERGVRIAPPDVIDCYQSLFGDAAADPVTALTALGRADVERRTFLSRAAYSATLSASALIVPAFKRIIAVNGSRTVGMGEIEALRQFTEAFQRMDEHQGGGVGRSALAELLATDVAAVLRARHATAQVRAHAFSVAAELAYLAGFKAHDCGQNGIAQRYYLRALELAEESGVPGHDAWTFRILALQSADLGERTYTVALAEEAVRRAKGCVPADVEALFTIALARCYAENGNPRAALATLHSGEAAVASNASADMPSWCAWWCGDRASMHNQTAKTLRAMGEWREAGVHHLQATTFWDPEQQRRVYSRTMTDLGVARWQSGDLGGAVEAWKTAIPILRQLDSARADTSLAKIGQRVPELLAV